jgi:PTS system nitrogen regulatory IIA component
MKEKGNLTAEQVAQLLDLPLVTIQRWAHQGKIPSRLVNRQKCFKRRDILEWAVDHDFKIQPGIQRTAVHSDDILAPAIELGGIYNDIPGEDIVEVYKNAISRLSFLPENDRNRILNGLLDREELASTGIGRGIAIPHTRNRIPIGSDRIYIPVMFLMNEIEFNAIDGEPVRVLFMIFTGNTRDHLSVLSRISHTLRDDKVLQILREKNRKNNLLERITKIEHEISA